MTQADRTMPATLQRLAPRLVLASGSHTRLALLRGAGLAVEARPAAVDEAVLKQLAHDRSMQPADAALMLAQHKALAIDDPDALIIGADQILVCGERWFDKPADIDAARSQLQALQGQSHTLYSAVACVRQGSVRWRHVATPTLRMRPLSDAFLDAYLALEGRQVLGSVGCYRLEGAGIHLFDAVDGEHAAILGLPMLALLAHLRDQDLLLR